SILLEYDLISDEKDHDREERDHQPVGGSFVLWTLILGQSVSFLSSALPKFRRGGAISTAPEMIQAQGQVWSWGGREFDWQSFRAGSGLLPFMADTNGLADRLLRQNSGVIAACGKRMAAQDTPHRLKHTAKRAILGNGFGGIVGTGGHETAGI